MTMDLDHQLLHDGITLHKETTLCQTMINFKYFITMFVASRFTVPKILVSQILIQKKYVLGKTQLKYTLLSEPHIWIFFLRYHSQIQESCRS